MRKVEGILARRGRMEVFFSGCIITCENLKQIGLDLDFERGTPWLFECDVCLWEACFRRFEMKFKMEYYVDLFTRY